ncbi:LANO_0G15016g1_1 [Lachancea nothofagi CBS 11611]|uniref:LANO_0G15016g1_1 n=1 Tax=Lachancea nothofagi CBS 11611 TaxID=1266666 RepID=A0A1G4KK77_9SACH|nr:LANO_0G15016g1_1 [Lachancea nothofagi CBS 11611]
MQKQTRGGLTAATGNILNSISPNVGRLSGKQVRQGEASKIVRAANALSTTANSDIKTLGENKPGSSISSERSDEAESEAVLQLNEFKDQCVTSQKVTPLFIGDLNQCVTEKMLKTVFCKFPSLQSVKICVDAATNRSLGYGYLNFSSEDDAQKVIEEFSYVNLFDKEVRIMPSMRNAFFRKNIGTNVFFANLPLENPNLTTRAFYETFNHYGRVLSCKLDKRKNIGFVYFESDAVAKKVIDEFNNTDFYGNNISCGLHFDKDIRKSPEFEKRKAKLEGLTKESLITDDETEIEYGERSNGPHPNSIHVKNLPTGADDETLLDFFSKVGPVKSIFTAKCRLHKDSNWGFVTYKKGCDTHQALEKFNGAYLQGKQLVVTKGQKKDSRNKCVDTPERKSVHKKSIASLLSNGYRQTLYLSNLSSICNEQFLTQLCHTEKISYRRILIDQYDEDSLTFVGNILCNSRPDANRLFESLNGKLVGDSVVQISWRPFFTQTQVPFASSKLNGSSQQESNSSVGGANLYAGPRNASRYERHTMYAPSVGSVERGPPHFAKSQLLDVLKNEIRKSMDFITYPNASREANLKCISEYIFDVYWRSDVESLAKFILLMNTKPQHGRILQKQVQEAVVFLGFQR